MVAYACLVLVSTLRVHRFVSVGRFIVCCLSRRCARQTVNLYDNQTIPESQYSQWLGEWNDMVLAAGVETQTQADETAADEADGGEPEAAAAGPVARRSKRKR